MIAAPAPAVQAFAEEVAATGPVTCVGGRTQWHVGGAPSPDGREVEAPAGVVQVLPAEMIVRVRAGTPLTELAAALAAVGQEAVITHAEGSTVGGALAVGRGGFLQLGHGPVRDSVLELTWVSAEGEVVRNGGAVVKNVSGFDLCRLLVGSLGTLGFLAEAVLRTRPLPTRRCWFAGAADPVAVLAGLHAPASVLWDGSRTWAAVEGAAADIAEQRRRAGALGLDEVEGPPPAPAHRSSVRRDRLRSEVQGHGRFLAAFGVGVVWSDQPGPAPRISRTAAELHRGVKDRFDPTGRLNPGRNGLSGVDVVDDEEMLP